MAQSDRERAGLRNLVKTCIFFGGNTIGTERFLSGAIPMTTVSKGPLRRSTMPTSASSEL